MGSATTPEDISDVSANGGTSSPAQITGHRDGSGDDSGHLSLRLAKGILGVIDVTMVSHFADMTV
jgi:hypothetical protein